MRAAHVRLGAQPFKGPESEHGESATRTWGVGTDGCEAVSSYNGCMTTITTQDISPQPARRLTRPSIVGFVAGLALASAAAVGVNVAAGDHHTASIPGSTLSVPAAAVDPGCAVTFHGAC